MNDQNGNGKPDKEALKNAFRVLHGAIRHTERKARRIQKSGLMYGPRQYCSVCGTSFDMAMVPREAIVTKSICSKCKALLAQGYTACITSDKFAFVKSAHLKETGMAGKIVPVSDEVYAKIKEKQDVPRPPILPS